MLAAVSRPREMHKEGMDAAAAADAADASREGLRRSAWIDRFAIGAVALIVVLVTIPHVDRLARRDNEIDAMRTLRVLAVQPASPGTDARLHTLAQLVGGDKLLARRLEDVEWMQDGRLRRHGYYFDIAQRPGGDALLRAWPVEAGTTGRAVFVWSPRTGLQGHDNPDLLFTGPRPPEGADLASGGWKPMQRAAR